MFKLIKTIKKYEIYNKKIISSYRNTFNLMCIYRFLILLNNDKDNQNYKI